ncbi:MAG: hypothetical protein K2U26_20300 [Cyclobacteriaceae bacterium]|nr:hypothetical protein [Cyclobacteriaceae bacterium]
MKMLGALLVVGMLAGCQQNAVVSEFTGNETTYALQPGSAYEINGTITFRERKDGKIAASINLKGTDGDAK